MKKTKNLVVTALLIALGVIIPAISVPIIPDPAVSATLAAHVPVIVAMFINPGVAAATAIGTTLGFVLKGYPFIVALRAFVHLIFAIVGSFMLRGTKGKPVRDIWLTVFLTYLVTMILHTIAELTAIYLVTPDAVHMMVGAGIFVLHHTIDFAISVVIVGALKSVKGIDVF